MSDLTTIHVNLPADDQGMVGRLCHSCEQYFKVKPGTGLPTTDCSCPYCEHKADYSEFATPDQIEFAKSVAVKQLIEPSLRGLEHSLRRLERSTRGSLIQIKARTSGLAFPIRYYTEKRLETTVTCDGCGLVFAIFGVFASCPECTRLTTMSLFQKSLETAGKRLDILEAVPESDAETREIILLDSIAAIVSSFDGLGKRLAQEFPSVVPDRPRNLFQNLDALNEAISKATGAHLETLLAAGDYSRLYYLFQVRHISSHNFGEIDDDFMRKTGVPPAMKGKKPQISPAEVRDSIPLTLSLGKSLRQKLRDCA